MRRRRRLLLGIREGAREGGARRRRRAFLALAVAARGTSSPQLRSDALLLSLRDLRRLPLDEIVVEFARVRARVREPRKVPQEPLAVPAGGRVHRRRHPHGAHALDERHELVERGVFAVRHGVAPRRAAVLDPRATRVGQERRRRRRGIGRDRDGARRRKSPRPNTRRRHLRLDHLRLHLRHLHRRDHLLLHALLLHALLTRLIVPPLRPGFFPRGPGPGPGPPSRAPPPSRVAPPRRSERDDRAEPRAIRPRVDVRPLHHLRHRLVRRPAAHRRHPRPARGRRERVSRGEVFSRGGVGGVGGVFRVGALVAVSPPAWEHLHASSSPLPLRLLAHRRLDRALVVLAHEQRLVPPPGELERSRSVPPDARAGARGARHRSHGALLPDGVRPDEEERSRLAPQLAADDLRHRLARHVAVRERPPGVAVRRVEHELVDASVRAKQRREEGIVAHGAGRAEVARVKHHAVRRAVAEVQERGAGAVVRVEERHDRLAAVGERDGGVVAHRHRADEGGADARDRGEQSGGGGGAVDGRGALKAGV